MVYMGSKAKYSEDIVPALQKIINDKKVTQYIEPFVGGANIIDKIKCDEKIGYDKNYPLICLHQQAQKDSSIIPEHGSPDWWYTAKNIYLNARGNPEEIEKHSNEMEAWKIGAIEFLASYSNGGFSRGYGKNVKNRDFYNEAYRNFKAQFAKEEYKNIIFKYCDDYKNIENCNGALIYCDPPYEGTKPYGYTFETSFNYSDYWNWVREMSKTNYVVCSEQVFPEDFNVIWTQKVNRTCGADNHFRAVEKLGVYKKGLLD